MEIAATLGTEVAGLLARTIGWLCEGQIEELRHTYDVTRAEDSYLTSIHGKTASLYGTAARIGAIVAGHDRVVIDVLTDYGNAFGIVFQIVDDILDITSTNGDLGKPAGHDLVEGVYTLPVIRTLAVEAPASARLASILGSPLDVDQRDQALAIVRSGPGIASSIATARGYVAGGGGVRRHPRLGRHDRAARRAGCAARIRRRPRLTARAHWPAPPAAGSPGAIPDQSLFRETTATFLDELVPVDGLRDLREGGRAGEVRPSGRGRPGDLGRIRSGFRPGFDRDRRRARSRSDLAARSQDRVDEGVFELVESPRNRAFSRTEHSRSERC